MHFRVFVPCDRPQSHDNASCDLLLHVGLKHLAEGAHTHAATVEGKSGIVYFWPKPGDTVAIRDTLKWEPALPFRGLEAGRYFIGMDPEKPPRSEQLVVALPIPGEHLLLNDLTQAWIVPDVLFLPAQMVLTADGVKMERLSRFQGRTFDAASWIARCGEFTKQIRDGRAEEGVDWEKGWNFAYDSLALNYRLTPEVVNRLGIITTDSIRSVILSAIGAVEIHRAQKLQPEALLIDGEGTDG